jgi:chromate transport protein ChrA
MKLHGPGNIKHWPIFIAWAKYGVFELGSGGGQIALTFFSKTVNNRQWKNIYIYISSGMALLSD